MHKGPGDIQRRPALTIMTTRLDLGGAELQATRLVVGFVRRGWRVRMLSLLPTRAYRESIEAEGVQIVDLGLSGAASLPGAAWRLFRELRRNRPDVLVTFNFHANIMGKVLGRLAGIRAIIPSIRNEYFGGRWRVFLESITAQLTPITTTNSEYVSEMLVRRGVVPRRRMRVVHNAAAGRMAAIDPVERQRVRREIGACEDDFLWLAIGRFEDQKDYPTLFAAFAELVSMNPKAYLAIIGHGSLEEQIRIMAEGSSATDRMCVLGRRTDAPDLLRAADAYVLSSLNEGTPNTVIEAIEAEIPVVATDVGGTAELIEDGVSGFLVMSGDPPALTRAMMQAQRLSREARSAMCRQATERLQLRHGGEAVLDRWEELCREAMNASV